MGKIKSLAAIVATAATLSCAPQSHVPEQEPRITHSSLQTSADQTIISTLYGITASVYVNGQDYKFFENSKTIQVVIPEAEDRSKTQLNALIIQALHSQLQRRGYQISAVGLAGFEQDLSEKEIMQRTDRVVQVNANQSRSTQTKRKLTEEVLHAVEQADLLTPDQFGVINQQLSINANINPYLATKQLENMSEYHFGSGLAYANAFDSLQIPAFGIDDQQKLSQTIYANTYHELKMAQMFIDQSLETLDVLANTNDIQVRVAANRLALQVAVSQNDCANALQKLSEDKSDFAQGFRTIYNDLHESMKKGSITYQRLCSSVRSVMVNSRPQSWVSADDQQNGIILMIIPSSAVSSYKAHAEQAQQSFVVLKEPKRVPTVSYTGR